MTKPIRSHHRAAGALLVLLLAAISATGQPRQLPRTPAPPASARVESKTGEISGKVVTDSGQPLANANVYVRPAAPERPQVILTTNREGGFKATGLQPGWYTVNAAMPAYIPKSNSGPTVPGTSDSVTLVLMKGGVITGTVTNSKGDPVVAIGIRVERVLDESGRPSPANTFDTLTDDRGVYRIYGLPSGTYIVAADGGADYSPTGVNAFAKEMPTYAPSSSREAADKISVRVGEETSGVDIHYRGERGSTISGIVRAMGTDDKGFSVTLTSLAEKGPRWNTNFKDPNGEFAFEGIPDGEYQIVAMAHWNDWERGLSESMVLKVQSADIGGIELTASALASVSGVVVLKKLEEPGPACTDKRQPQFSHMSVSAWHRATQEGKKKPQFVLRGDITIPNPQGHLTLQRLAASEYHFNVHFSGEQWYLQSIAFVPQTPGSKPTDATRSWTTLKPGDQLSGLTFTLAQGAAQVQGQITLAEGQKLSDKLSVYLVPAEAAQAEDALRYFAAPVNTEGNFWLNNVVPGRYWMLAQTGIDDTRVDVSKIRLPDAAGTRSSLRHAAEQRKIEIELKACQNVTFQLPL